MRSVDYKKNILDEVKIQRSYGVCMAVFQPFCNIQKYPRLQELFDNLSQLPRHMLTTHICATPQEQSTRTVARLDFERELRGIRCPDASIVRRTIRKPQRSTTGFS